MFYFSFRPVKKWVLIILVWILYCISELGTRNNCRVILTEFVGAKIMLIFALTLRQLHCDTDDFYLSFVCHKSSYRLSRCRSRDANKLTRAQLCNIFCKALEFEISYEWNENCDKKICLELKESWENQWQILSSRPKTCRTSKSPILANSHLHNIYFPRVWNYSCCKISFRQECKYKI